MTSEKTCVYLTRHIGSTTYKLKIHFAEDGAETMEDKIIRMIQNEALENAPEYGIMEAPQMSRQSERSA